MVMVTVDSTVWIDLDLQNDKIDFVAVVVALIVPEYSSILVESNKLKDSYFDNDHDL